MSPADNWGMGRAAHKYMACSAQLISFEIDCFTVCVLEFVNMKALMVCI